VYAHTHTHTQVLFLGGLFLIIGPQKTFFFFARRNKLRGTICFLGGILLVFLKWPTIGVLVEMFGFLNLFGCVFKSPSTRRTQNILIPRSCRFQRFLPRHHHFPPPTAVRWPFLEFTIYPPCTPPFPIFSSAMSDAYSRDGHVPQLVDRLAGSRTSVV
jgi:hypothetical protein